MDVNVGDRVFYEIVVDSFKVESGWGKVEEIHEAKDSTFAAQYPYELRLENAKEEDSFGLVSRDEIKQVDSTEDDFK